MAQVKVSEGEIRRVYEKRFGVFPVSILDSKKFVVKVDDTIGGRFKKGLIKVGVTKREAKEFEKELQVKGYKKILTLPYFPHEKEYYFSIESFSDYDLLRLGNVGGVEVEESWDKLSEYRIPIIENWKQDNNIQKIFVEISRNHLTEIQNTNLLLEIYDFYIQNSFSFLEINPFTILQGNFIPLDFKGRIDNMGKSEVTISEVNDKSVSKEEKNIAELDKNTSSSLKFQLLNKDARVWPLIAGGGASIVFYDLINKKFGKKENAFYGEYSGNPTTDLMYEYCKNIFTLLLKSNANNKILVIAGGNANFTYIPNTFKGIIKAIEEIMQELKKQKVLVLVRRGGPNDTEGLKLIKEFLDKNQLENRVYGMETDIVDVFNNI